MTEQFSEITVGIAPEVETVTPQWVVAEEYEKLQARIEDLETELARERIRLEMKDISLDAYKSMAISRVMGQCTPSRKTTTGFQGLGRQIDLMLGL